MNIKSIALVLCVLLLPIFLYGCAGTGPAPSPAPPTPSPTCAEVYVVSNCPYIFGTVFVNGIAHGEQLPFSMGSTAVLVNRPQIRCGDIVSVYIQRPDGYKTVILSQNAVPPRTIFTFECIHTEDQQVWPIPPGAVAVVE